MRQSRAAGFRRIVEHKTTMFQGLATAIIGISEALKDLRLQIALIKNNNN